MRKYRYTLQIGSKTVARLDAERDDVVWLARELSYRRPDEWVTARDNLTAQVVCRIEPTSVVSSSDTDQPELC